MAVLHIQAKIQWKAFRDPSSKIWVAVCQPLKLTVQGETWGALMECINDTLNLLFNALMESGDFEKFLRKHGWKKLNELPPKSSRVKFDVPFDVQRRNRPYDYDTAGALC